MKKKTQKLRVSMQEECDNTVHKFQTDTQPVGYTKELYVKLSCCLRF